MKTTIFLWSNGLTSILIITWVIIRFHFPKLQRWGFVVRSVKNPTSFEIFSVLYYAIFVVAGIHIIVPTILMGWSGGLLMSIPIITVYIIHRSPNMIPPLTERNKVLISITFLIFASVVFPVSVLVLYYVIPSLGMK